MYPALGCQCAKLDFMPNASENPILIRLSSDSGHGMGTALAERIAETADVMAFLYQQLEMEPQTS